MYHLICEGPCNPGLSELDTLIRDYRREEAKGMDRKRLPLDDARLLAAVKLLTHTDHTLRGDTHAVCNTCSTTRRWGQSEMWDRL